MKIRQGLWGKIFLYFFLCVVLFFTLVPIIYTISASFKTNSEILLGGAHIIPKEFTFDNYRTAWTMGGGSALGGNATFAHFTLNSLKMSAVTVVGTLLFTSMTAYCFSRGNFPGKKFLYWTFISTMFIAAGSITLFPIFQLTSAIHMNNLFGASLVQIFTAAAIHMNNLFGASLVQIFTAAATNLLLTVGYLKTISREIDEAAKIDGCSFFGIYYRILLPLMKPILATVALMSFRASWNDYLLPMMMTLGKPESYPLVVGVVQLKSMGGEGAAQYNLMMAGTMFSIIPIVVLYLCMNKYFVAGMTAGSVKG